MTAGWIKLNRDIMNHWVYRDPEYFRAWVTMLMMANHEGQTVLVGKTPVTIKRGSFFSSIRDLADRLSMERRKLMHLIMVLETEQMLTTKRTTNGTTFCVVNYDKYQATSTTDGTTNRTTNRTTDGTTTCTTTCTTINKNEKNDKNDKNDKNIYTRTRTCVRHQYGEYKNVLLSDSDLEKLKEIFPDDYESRIEALSSYMRSTGKSYKDHLATIRNWDRMRKERAAAVPHRPTLEEEQAKRLEAFFERHKGEFDDDKEVEG